MDRRPVGPQRPKPRPAGGSKSRRLLASAGWLAAGVLAVYVAIDKWHMPAPSGELPPAQVSIPPTKAPSVEAPQPTPTADPYLYPTWSSAPSLAPAEGVKGALQTPAPPPQSPPTQDVTPVPAQVPVPQPTPEALYGLDAEREKAAFLLPELDRLVRDRQRLAALEEAYKRDCWGFVGGGGESVPLQLSGTPACQRLESTIKGIQDSLSGGCAAVKDAAKRGRILPGILRELAAARGLEQCLNP